MLDSCLCHLESTSSLSAKATPMLTRNLKVQPLPGTECRDVSWSRALSQTTNRWNTTLVQSSPGWGLSPHASGQQAAEGSGRGPLESLWPFGMQALPHTVTVSENRVSGKAPSHRQTLISQICYNFIVIDLVSPSPHFVSVSLLPALWN